MRHPARPAARPQEIADRSAAASAARGGRGIYDAEDLTPGEGTRMVGIGYLVRDTYIKVATRDRALGPQPERRAAADVVAETARKLTIMLGRRFTENDVLQHLKPERPVRA